MLPYMELLSARDLLSKAAQIGAYVIRMHPEVYGQYRVALLIAKRWERTYEHWKRYPAKRARQRRISCGG